MMKIKDDIDLTTIITTLGFIVAMVAWGIRLEGKVSSVASNLDSKEEMYSRLNNVRQQNLERRLNAMGQEIIVIKQRLREHTDRGPYRERKNQD